MNRRRGLRMLGMLVVVSGGAAITGGSEIDWFSVDGGGAGIDGGSVGGSYTLSGTIGQPDARNEAMTGGSYSLVGGFWVAPVPSCYPDLDGDGDVDGIDFLTFSLCFNGSLRPPQSGCATLNADLNGDNDVDGNDFITFSLCYNGSLRPPQAGCPCLGGS